jgi:hypothetical protein
VPAFTGNLQLALSVLSLGLGLAMMASTALIGGSGTSVGFLLGLALVLNGALRLWVWMRRRSG